jgi:hypothetical protein
VVFAIAGLEAHGFLEFAAGPVELMSHRVLHADEEVVVGQIGIDFDEAKSLWIQNNGLVRDGWRVGSGWVERGSEIHNIAERMNAWTAWGIELRQLASFEMIRVERVGGL